MLAHPSMNCVTNQSWMCLIERALLLGIGVALLHWGKSSSFSPQLNHQYHANEQFNQLSLQSFCIAKCITLWIIKLVRKYLEISSSLMRGSFQCTWMVLRVVLTHLVVMNELSSWNGTFVIRKCLLLWMRWEYHRPKFIVDSILVKRELFKTWMLELVEWMI